VDDAEALGVAEGPFQVVEERPDEVAADVDSGLDRGAEGGDVVAQVTDAEGVVDRFVDGARRVVERGAVFGDVDRDGACPGSRPVTRRDRPS